MRVRVIYMFIAVQVSILIVTCTTIVSYCVYVFSVSNCGVLCVSVYAPASVHVLDILGRHKKVHATYVWKCHMCVRVWLTVWGHEFYTLVLYIKSSSIKHVCMHSCGHLWPHTDVCVFTFVSRWSSLNCYACVCVRTCICVWARASVCAHVHLCVL